MCWTNLLILFKNILLTYFLKIWNWFYVTSLMARDNLLCIIQMIYVFTFGRNEQNMILINLRNVDLYFIKSFSFICTRWLPTFLLFSVLIIFILSSYLSPNRLRIRAQYIKWENQFVPFEKCRSKWHDSVICTNMCLNCSISLTGMRFANCNTHLSQYV